MANVCPRQNAKSLGKSRVSPARYSRSVRSDGLAGADTLSSSQFSRKACNLLLARPCDLHSGLGNGWSRNAAPTHEGVNQAALPSRPGVVNARGQDRASKLRGSFQNFKLPSVRRGCSSCQRARVPEYSGLNTGGCAKATSSRLPSAPAIHATSFRTKAKGSGPRELLRFGSAD